MNAIGVATVWGMNGTLAIAAFTGGATILATTANKLMGGSLSDEVAVGTLEAGGEIIGKSFANRMHKITFEIVPIDATTIPPSLATSKSHIVLPDPGAKVTIAGFGNSLYDGDWNYVGGGTITPGTQPTEHLKITIPCERFGSTPAALAAVAA